MRLIVFTDLDGTLLDHHSYGFEAAQPALDLLRANAIPVILASSKTAAELQKIRQDLALETWPAIVENGAGLLQAGERPGGGAADYGRLRAAIYAVPPALRAPFRGFGDMSDDEVAEVTGLSVEMARRARARAYSEPGLWSGDDAALEAFCDLLAGHGIVARRGGRFLTLSYGRSKADAMRDVLRICLADRVIALGDAPNDVEMIEAADIGVIIRNDDGPGIPPLPGEATGRIRRPARPGPGGWSDALLEILREQGIS